MTRAITAGAACLAVAAAVGGCATSASTTTSVSATGQTLTLYISVPSGAGVPPGAGTDQAVQDVIDAEQLAFKQESSTVTRYRVRLLFVDKPELSSNARTAIQNKSVIAYLGEIAPGTSEQSVGITNAQDLLQVSPTDTALELNTKTPAVSGAPNRYYESLSLYGRTFGRIVPDSAVEAQAQVAEMTALGVKRLAVGDDGSDYGAAIAQAVRSDATAKGITIASSPSGADGYFYGAVSPTAAVRAYTAAAATDPSLKLFGPSALENATFLSGLGASVKDLYISLPSAPPSAAATAFTKAFTTQFGHAPAPTAVFGYAAMGAVLGAIAKAGIDADDRAIVIHDFHTIKDESSAAGTFSIDAAGNSSLTAFAFYRPSAGALVPVKPTRG